MCGVNLPHQNLLTGIAATHHDPFHNFVHVVKEVKLILFIISNIFFKSPALSKAKGQSKANTNHIV